MSGSRPVGHGRGTTPAKPGRAERAPSRRISRRDHGEVAKQPIKRSIEGRLRDDLAASQKLVTRGFRDDDVLVDARSPARSVGSPRGTSS